MNECIVLFRILMHLQRSQSTLAGAQKVFHVSFSVCSQCTSSSQSSGRPFSKNCQGGFPQEFSLFTNPVKPRGGPYALHLHSSFETENQLEDFQLCSSYTVAKNDENQVPGSGSVVGGWSENRFESRNVLAWLSSSQSVKSSIFFVRAWGQVGYSQKVIGQEWGLF